MNLQGLGEKKKKAVEDNQRRLVDCVEHGKLKRILFAVDASEKYRKIRENWCHGVGPSLHTFINLYIRHQCPQTYSGPHSHHPSGRNVLEH